MTTPERTALRARLLAETETLLSGPWLRGTELRARLVVQAAQLRRPVPAAVELRPLEAAR